MEKRDLFGREEIINNEPNDREMKPLLVPTQPIYVKFRQGRETLAPVKSSEFALNVFKVCFSSVGLWNHQAWNFIPRVLLATVCLYQVSYSLYFDVLDKCRLIYKNETEKEKIAMEHSTYTEHIAEALLNLASVSSFLVFTGCFMVAKRKRSACVLPSLSTIENNDRKITLTLFAFFIFTTLLLASAIGLLYNTSIEIKLVEGSFCRHILVAAIAVQFLLHWVALNICHIFAFSSLALGTFAKDALRLIQNLQNGTLDDVIRIHEDLCSVVFSTASAYSVWFVLHWFTYGAGIPVAIIFVSRGLELIPVLDRLHVSLYLVCLFYLFLLPSVCAARITNHCLGICEEINHTTSDDWNEGHPFKDRHNIALFVSYAKERRCGFKIGKITFNASLAWVSFFFGLTALLFHFF